MNEALRLLRRMVRPLGYDLRKRHQFVFRPVKGLDKLADPAFLETAMARFDREAEGELAANLNRLIIYVRTCVREDRNINRAPRLGGASYEEIVLRCLTSLTRSIAHAVSGAPPGEIEVLVLDDRSDAETIGKMKAVLENLPVPWSFQTTREKGQGNSLLEQFSRGRQEDALVYFCEDDYLHEPTAIEDMWNFYRIVAKATGGHCVLHPQEHKDLYEAYFPSYLVAAANRRWRTMANATHVLFTHGQVVDQHWDCFKNTKYMGVKGKAQRGSEHVTTNRLFERMPGFSPIPPAAIHFQGEDLVPPFYDWRAKWEANDWRSGAA